MPRAYNVAVMIDYSRIIPVTKRDVHSQHNLRPFTLVKHGYVLRSNVPRNRWIASTETRINLSFPSCPLRGGAVNPITKAIGIFHVGPDDHLRTGARNPGTPGKFITHAGTCASIFFNSNNGPVIFYAEAIFITYVCLSPCLKGKYKLVVMPQCSSKSFLHQGHRRARVPARDTRGSHALFFNNV